MLRLTLYLAGLSAAVAAVILSRNRRPASPRIPIQQAAEQLRQAWADHHTLA